MVILLLAGIATGAASTVQMNQENIQLVTSRIGSFLELPADAFQYFLKECLMEGLVVLFLFCCGFSLLGIPAIVLFLLTKGFKTGLICSLLIHSYQIKGIIAIVMTILPAMCFQMIAELIVAVASLQLSFLLIQSIKEGSRKKGIMMVMNQKCSSLLVAFVFVGFYGAFQSTIGLWLLKAFQTFI